MTWRQVVWRRWRWCRRRCSGATSASRGPLPFATNDFTWSAKSKMSNLNSKQSPPTIVISTNFEQESWDLKQQDSTQTLVYFMPQENWLRGSSRTALRPSAKTQLVGVSYPNTFEPTRRHLIFMSFNHFYTNSYIGAHGKITILVFIGHFLPLCFWWRCTVLSTICKPCPSDSNSQIWRFHNTKYNTIFLVNLSSADLSGL